MWIVFAKSPRPDAKYFPGRRLLALLDAVAWPLALFVAISAVPFATGIIGAVAKALLLLSAVRRSYRGVFRNERYRFTTVTWGVPVIGLIAFGEVLRFFS